MDFFRKIVRKLVTVEGDCITNAEMSTGQQDEEPMDVDDPHGLETVDSPELEAVDSPEFDAVDSPEADLGNNTTEDEEDADEENRDPRSFLSTQLGQSNTQHDSEDEFHLEDQADANSVDPLNEVGDNEDIEDSSNAAKEDDLVNGENKSDDEDDDEGGDNAAEHTNENDDEEEAVILNSNEKDEDEGEGDDNAVGDTNENDDEEQEAVINLNSNEKDEEEEEDDDQEKQNNPLEDEDSDDNNDKEKESNIFPDEDSNVNDTEFDSNKEKEDIFVAEENSNSNSNENVAKRKADLFVADDDDEKEKSDLFVTADESIDKDGSDNDDSNETKVTPSHSEDKNKCIEVLDIDDDSDEKESNDGKGDKEKGRGTEEDPVDLEADEELLGSHESSPVALDDNEDNNEDNSPVALNDNEDNNSPVALDGNEDATSPKSQRASGGDKSDDEDDMPKIRISSGIFDQPAEEEDDDDDNMDIQSMMQVEMMEDNDEVEAYEDKEPPKKAKTQEVVEETPGRRTLPRRAAARAAASTIKEITSIELEDDDKYGRRVVGRKPSPDRDYDENEGTSEPTRHHSNQTDQHRCHVCKKMSTCPIVVRQYGADVHMCSNSCFNTFRNPDPSKRPLPCAHCGLINRDTDDKSIYFWETMNFCSDLCVAKYQFEVGGKCSTCLKKVMWNCLGKYCVRFGSDIRQFCTSSCLEAYKKNARVCFHCQLDIKRLGNVVLANIPAKASPKEFCSQDCVEMYIEQNLKQTVRQKPGAIINCLMCGSEKNVFRELVTTNGSYKVCTEYCWRQLLASKSVTKAAKCESCLKYVNMDFANLSPNQFISTSARIHGFCSPTCKNVFVLKNRSILACTTCKVKKYNYDLIEHVSSKQGSAGFAVCSLNCIPNKTGMYIYQLKEMFNNNTIATATTCIVGVTATKTLVSNRTYDTNTTDCYTVPIISSVTSVPSESTDMETNNSSDSNIQIQSVVTLADGESMYMDGASSSDMYEGVEEFGVGDGDTDEYYEDLVAEVEEMKKMYQEVYDQLEKINQEKSSPDQRTVSCWIKPSHESKECQTDVSELNEMGRIEMVPQEKIIYVPVPFPCPVILPFPFYALDTPVPYPFPVPLPLPIPIPVIIPENSKSKIAASNSRRNSDSTSNSNDVLANLGLDNVDLCPLPINISSSILQLNEDASSPTSLMGTPSQSTNVAGGKSKSQALSDCGIKAWRSYFGQDSDPTFFKSYELGDKLAEFVKRVTRPTKEKYPADTLLYLCLGIQQYLRDKERTEYIFYDDDFTTFVQAFTNYAEDGIARDIVLNKIDDSNFWETVELGAPSPGVLLFTVIYINYKYFNLKTWEAHSALQFHDVHIVERQDMETGDTSKYLTVTTPDGNSTEIAEKTYTKERCPVNIFEFYQMKCSSSNQTGCFYKTPIKSYTPRSDWFCSEPLDQLIIYRMLVRAMMIKADCDRR